MKNVGQVHVFPANHDFFVGQEKRPGLKGADVHLSSGVWKQTANGKLLGSHHFSAKTNEFLESICFSGIGLNAVIISFQT